jgi:hypothetical protein
LRTKSFRNFLILNSRTITLFSFYAFVAVISLIPYSRIEAHEFISTYRCSMYGQFDSFLVLLTFMVLFLFFLPTLYWMIALTTVFSKVFGGERDPIANRLTNQDLAHLKYIKLASILKFVENFFLHVVSTHDFSISKNFYEITRISGLGIVLSAALLYALMENVLVSLRRGLCLMSDEGGNRATYFVFRSNREVDEETIVYRNLVESA